MSAKLQTLDEIMLATGTDKNSLGHGYSYIYDNLFGPWRTKPLTFLELGVWEGASLRAWSQYFTHPKARIFGADNDLVRLAPVDDERITALPARLEMPESVSALATAIATPIDLIVDDASHGAFQQHVCWNMLWSRLVPGGLYVIEDLHTYFWPHSNPPISKDWLHGFADAALGLGTEPKDNHGEIESITFRASMVILRKRL